MKNIIKRELYLEKIRPYYDIDIIKVLAGMRRSGKSIILKQIMDEIISTSKVSKDHIIYINFEDFAYEEIKTAKLFYELVKSKMIDDEKYYMFFDEIQHVSEFEKVIASFKATCNCSIFITGSNSKLLSGELATLLVGRTVEFKILPFSYKESCDYLELNGVNVNHDEFFYNYLEFGGLPQRFDFKSPDATLKYLKEHYQGICEKDIFKKNSSIEKYKFNAICSYVLANAGKEFSAENVMNFYNSNNQAAKKEIEKKTIYNYLEKMEKAFLISRVQRFNIAGKEILKTKEKQYAMDMGLRIIQTNTVHFEDTFFLENIIYNELIVRDYEVFVGKTYKGEVDFVAIKGNKKCFIQVAYLLASQATIDREFDAFSPISDASPKYVLSLDKMDMSRNGIAHINIIDFLLGKKDIYLT
ncbi:MAG: ATP-binding protein [Bacilli bacterium]|nr:ATP-binding protein [Bacilli bacterium]